MELVFINTLTGWWTTCGPSKTYPLAGRWTQRGPSIQQFAKNRGILPAGSSFGSYMVHELYCYTHKHLLQSSLIISACQCSVGNYWVWLWCVLLPLATALALKCLPCILLFILYFDVSGEYFGIVNCNVTWFTMSQYISSFCYAFHKSVTKMFMLCMQSLVSASFCALSLRCCK